jgi:hypothetical protein
MRSAARTVFSALVLTGTAGTPAFSQLPFPDRDRPEFMRVTPAISSETAPAGEAGFRVPLPRARPRMSIPLPRPAPANATATTAIPVTPELTSAPTLISTPDAELLPDPPGEPVIVAPPAAAGGRMMPIPQMPIPLSAPPPPASEATGAHGSAFLPLLAQ